MTADAIDQFQFEREHHARGLRRLAGVDEAGRGPLAGPVVAAAAVLPADWVVGGVPESLERLNDSKKLTEKTREEIFEGIHAEPIEFGVGIASEGVIDEINILQATFRAMNEALGQINPAPMHALVDGRPVPSLCLPHTAIIKGDARSYSIATASILAKVTRDGLMRAYDLQFPGYGFSQHKGYGTKAHLAAIEKLGPCPIHRQSFAPLRTDSPGLF